MMAFDKYRHMSVGDASDMIGLIDEVTNLIKTAAMSMAMADDESDVLEGLAFAAAETIRTHDAEAFWTIPRLTGLIMVRNASEAVLQSLKETQSTRPGGMQ